MPIVNITLDTSSAGREDIEGLLVDGKVIGATGLINLKWEDFSAVDIARSIGLQGTIWQSSHDDTPSFLTLAVRYANLTLDEVNARFEDRHEIEAYEIQR